MAVDMGALCRAVRVVGEAQERLRFGESIGTDNKGMAYRLSWGRRNGPKPLYPDDPKHGTNNGYINYGCRCERCVKAASEYRKRRRERHGQDSAEPL